MAAKRVACLYRVSTKGQVDHNDIPMQKSACREFAMQKGWKLVKEYQEQGVSGYKRSLNERDVLQQVQKDATSGLFDILLVFMFDRLGRKDDETPFVVEWFVQQGIEVWSVKEGQQRFEDHVDKLINYLRFWQSSGESYKTSLRVDESHRQLTEQGTYRGGVPAYGYKTIPSGRFNKKGKELQDLAIDEKEAKVVKKIYTLTLEKHWGGGKVARYLNDKGYKTRNNRNWTSRAVNLILRNPIYKGYLVYGRTTSDRNGNQITQDKSKWTISEQIPELVIIDENDWERVREIKRAKSPAGRKNLNSNNDVVVTSGSPLLLVGMIRCGHCGKPLTTTYNTKSWTRKDGTTRKRRSAKYRCSGKALGSTRCDGQTLYGKYKIEGIVLEEIETYLERLSNIDLEEEIKKMQSKTLQQDKNELRNLQKQNENNYEELAVLKGEIAKSLMGKSSFEPDMLSELITKKEVEIDECNKKIQKLDEDIKSGELKVDSVKVLQSTIPNWKNEFYELDTDRQKVLLRSIIDEVVVYRDRVEINIKMHLQQFLQNMGSVDRNDGSPMVLANTSHDIILEDFIKVLYNRTA